MTRLDETLQFWTWFDKERDRLSIRQVEQQGGCPRGRIGNAYSEKREPTFGVCTAIAAALDLDACDVFRRAGLIPPLRQTADERQLAELGRVFNRLPLHERELVLEFARWRLSKTSK